MDGWDDDGWMMIDGWMDEIEDGWDGLPQSACRAPILCLCLHTIYEME